MGYFLVSCFTLLYIKANPGIFKYHVYNLRAYRENSTESSSRAFNESSIS